MGWPSIISAVTAASNPKPIWSAKSPAMTASSPFSSTTRYLNGNLFHRFYPKDGRAVLHQDKGRGYPPSPRRSLEQRLATGRICQARGPGVLPQADLRGRLPARTAAGSNAGDARRLSPQRLLLAGIRDSVSRAHGGAPDRAQPGSRTLREADRALVQRTDRRAMPSKARDRVLAQIGRA